MADKTWVVTLAPGQDVAAASRALKEAGLNVSAALDEIGVVTGAGDDDVAARLRELPGVSDVAEDQSIDIGPPGGPETW